MQTNDAVAVTLTRAELEGALALEGEPELVLELAREHEEQLTVSVAWTREDLERALAEAESEVTLFFDRAELEREPDDDVEAHGLRRPALVLTVAIAAGAFGSAANAAGPRDRAPDGYRYHGLELTAKRFHGAEPDAKRFHGVAPDAKRFHGIRWTAAKPDVGRWG